MKKEEVRDRLCYEITIKCNAVLSLREFYNSEKIHEPIVFNKQIDEIIPKIQGLINDNNLTDTEKDIVLFNIKSQIINFGNQFNDLNKGLYLRTARPVYRTNFETLNRIKEELLATFYPNEIKDKIIISIDSHYVLFLEELGIIEHLKSRYKGISDSKLAEVLETVSNGRSNLREGITGLNRRGEKNIRTTTAKTKIAEILKQLELPTIDKKGDAT